MRDLRHQLEQAIASLEAQRALLGDEVLAQAMAPLQARLAVLDGEIHEQQLRQVFVDAQAGRAFLAVDEYTVGHRGLSMRSRKDKRRALQPVV